MNGKKMITLLAAALLTISLAGAALAETLAPNPGKIDINHLEDRYVTTNIEYKGNGAATLTLLENEQFDGEAVKALKVGDVLQSDGEEIKVETLNWDGPDLRINEGTDKEALLCEAGEGLYERVEENDRVPQLKVGTLDCEILPYVVMLDWVDPVTGDLLENVAVRSGEELVKLLESGDGPSFAVENVHILYDHYNQPTLVWRFYSPAQ